MHKINDHIAKCDLCNKEIKLEALGLTALKRHAMQKKHRDIVESIQSNPSISANVSFSSNSCQSTSTNVNSSSSNTYPSISTNVNSSSTSTSVQLTERRSEDSATLTEQIANAEAMWSAMVAEHDIPFLTSDHFSKIVCKMFPDSAIAAGFKCGRTKTTYMLSDGISFDLQEKLTVPPECSIFTYDQ